MHGKAYVNVLLPKLLVQALRERAERKFGRRERRRGRVATQGGGGAGEEQRAALSPLLVDGLVLERRDRLAGKRKRRLDVRVCHSVDLVLGDLQERLPDAETRVEEGDADVRVWPVGAYRTERGLDFLVVVVGYWERGCLHEDECIFEMGGEKTGGSGG